MNIPIVIYKTIFFVRLYDIDRYTDGIIGIELLSYFLLFFFYLLTRLQAKNSIIALRAQHTICTRRAALTSCSSIENSITRFSIERPTVI